MEVFIRNIPYQASEAEVNDYFATLLHDHPALSTFRDRLPFKLNFKLFLHPDTRIRSRKHRGTGILTVPFEDLGLTLVGFGSYLPPIRERRISLLPSNKNPPMPTVYESLARTPYQDPRALREKEKLEEIFTAKLDVMALQFGYQCRDKVFSIEWERQYDTHTLQAQVTFSNTTREMIIREQVSGLADLWFRPSGPRARRVGIHFANVRSVWSSRVDSQPAVLLELYSPPTFEEEPFVILGFNSSGLMRTRTVCMDDANHKRVVPFTTLAVRIVFSSRENLRVFGDLAAAAHLPKIFSLPAPPERRELFTASNLHAVSTWLAGIPDFPVAFQCEALLQNLLLTPTEIQFLRPKLDTLVKAHKYSLCAEILRYLGMRLDTEGYTEPGPTSAQKIRRHIDHLYEEVNEQRILVQSALQEPSTNSIFQCHHCTVTPTKIWLEGPYPDQSNRVLRWFPNNQNAFLRVNFMDEEKLQFRWDRDVDGATFLRERVGGILKEGFVLAGRHFDFLAYSSSALNEHAVWFCTPFVAGDRRVDAASIRSRLGNFDNVIRFPAKYGARLSQGFSATDSAITITAEEILVIDDIIENGVLFTDGVAPMSRELANDIQTALTQSRRSKRRTLPRFEPSAFQVRIGGSKGMLSVDYQLTDNTVRVRQSMVKFSAPQSLDIEVAGTFERPGPMYLNRPLIVILETLGVPISAFTDLQTQITNTIRQSVLSTDASATLLQTYGLGTAFRLPSVLWSLNKLGIFTPPQDRFLNRGMDFAVNDILRVLKHKARIPVPDSWTLVGVADVHRYLEEGEIFVCIQDKYSPPYYLKGEVLITRSPAIHPGDIQMVKAIGAPPLGSPFAQENLANCVVFACKGVRSLPNSLGGGDLDGDLYNVITLPELYPKRTVVPARYDPVDPVELPRGQACTINDVADHVVNYLVNDHLGRIATDHLIIADQSKLMAEDPDCITLARLASQAVDFKKSGRPVNINEIPRHKFHNRPDWSAGEIIRQNKANVYESQRALGVLFRAIDLKELTRRTGHRGGDDDEDDLAGALAEVDLSEDILDDEISAVIHPEVGRYISTSGDGDFYHDDIGRDLDAFVSELRYICANHSLSRSRSLSEEECWAGTIAARSSQPKKRQDLQARMRSQTTELVNRLRAALSDSEDLEECLAKSWEAWKVSRALGDVFGARSFGFVALGSMFESMKAIDDRDRIW